MLGTFPDPKGNQWYNEDEERFYCEHCEEEVSEHVLYDIDGIIVCESCLCCSDCGADEADEDLYVNHNGTLLCKNCDSDWSRYSYEDGVEK